MADQNTNSASIPVPHDKEIPYAVNLHGQPTFPHPGKGMPGHKQADPMATQRQAAANHQASQNAAEAKRQATRRSDMRGAPRKGR